MRHRRDPEERGIWRRLADAGLVLIVFMGMGLIALALGIVIGMRMI